jgi:predicted nucleic acid-binding protein
VIRVVVDPGVFISALFGPRGGAPDIVVRAFIDDHLTVVASPLLLTELERVLRRAKFAPNTPTSERGASSSIGSAATRQSLKFPSMCLPRQGTAKTTTSSRSR